jgi:hypothetical protein
MLFVIGFSFADRIPMDRSARLSALWGGFFRRLPLCARWRSQRVARKASGNWPKQYVDGGLSGDFSDQVGPSFSEGTVAQRYAVSTRAKHIEIGAAFYLNGHVEHVPGSWS